MITTPRLPHLLGREHALVGGGSGGGVVLLFLCLFVFLVGARILYWFWHGTHFPFCTEPFRACEFCFSSYLLDTVSAARHLYQDDLVFVHSLSGVPFFNFFLGHAYCTKAHVSRSFP